MTSFTANVGEGAWQVWVKFSTPGNDINIHANAPWSNDSNDADAIVDVITFPTVTAVNRAAASPTNAGTVQWTVTFSQSVTGVGTSDFAAR